MLVKIGLLFLGSAFGYFTCCIMTASKIASIREETERYYKIKYEDLDKIFSDEEGFIPDKNEIELPEVENGTETD